MLVDFAMPGMSGADLAHQVRTSKPSVPTVVITGFADRSALAGISESCIIGKPFDQDELSRKISTALAGARSNIVRLPH